MSCCASGELKRFSGGRNPHFSCLLVRTAALAIKFLLAKAKYKSLDTTVVITLTV